MRSRFLSTRGDKVTAEMLELEIESERAGGRAASNSQMKILPYYD